MKSLKMLLVMVFMATLVMPAGAEWQRTVKVEDTLTVGRCKWQVDFNLDYYKTPESMVADLDIVEFGVLPRFGVLDRWDIAAYVPGMYVSDGDDEVGLGDIAVMTKYMFMDDIEKFIGLSVFGAIKTDSGDEDKNLGTGTMDYSIGVAASKVFGDLTIVGNLGFTYIDGDDNSMVDYKNPFFYGLEGIFRVCDLYDLSAFIVGASKRVDSGDGTAMAGVGMTIYPPWEYVSFQIIGAAGLTDDSPDYSGEIKARFLF